MSIGVQLRAESFPRRGLRASGASAAGPRPLGLLPRQGRAPLGAGFAILQPVAALLRDAWSLEAPGLFPGLSRHTESCCRPRQDAAPVPSSALQRPRSRSGALPAGLPVLRSPPAWRQNRLPGHFGAGSAKPGTASGSSIAGLVVAGWAMIPQHTNSITRHPLAIFDKSIGSLLDHMPVTISQEPGTSFSGGVPRARKNEDEDC